MNLPFDRIIMSANEDPLYINFWPYVAEAYKIMFGCPVHLGFLTFRAEDDPYVHNLRKSGQVTLFRPWKGNDLMIPEANQAKLARYALATMFDDVVYIDDIDLFPLNRDWICRTVAQRPKDHLLLVGAEVYGSTPQTRSQFTAPASKTTAEGHIFRKLLNPLGLDMPHDFSKLVRSWSSMGLSGKQDITNQTYHEEGPCFSDEHFLRALMDRHPVNVHYAERGYGGGVDEILHKTLDRMKWILDVEKLKNHGYLEAHHARPLSNGYEIDIQVLLVYIKDTYGS